MRILILTLSILALSGCASGHPDLKSPCGPSASLSQNPCVHIPFDLTMFEKQVVRNS